MSPLITQYNRHCYIAGNFFSTTRSLIGYFKVKWHLPMKLFPAKISERATLQNLWRQRVTLHCYPRMLTNDRFQLYYRGQIESQLCWDSRETKLTVSRANSHKVFNSLVGNERINFFLRDHFLYSPAFYQTVGGYKKKSDQYGYYLTLLHPWKRWGW